MIARRQLLVNITNANRRYISNEATKEGSKRFMQTIPTSSLGKNTFYSGLNYAISNNSSSNSPEGTGSSKWSKHSLNFPREPESNTQTAATTRRSRTSRFSNRSLKGLSTESTESSESQKDSVSVTGPSTESSAPIPNVQSTPEPKASEVQSTQSAKPKKRRTLRPRKALITLTPNAVEHLRGLLNQPQPKLIRIGVQNRGCSGLTYNLEYVDAPGKFDELIEQDDVKVLIDSKALFSIVGSEMDWLDDKLSSRFIFKNPNSKGTCGCGESFMV
ncbi:uncharacterized protein CANTADRAFT_27045 [Suhomyces tanzawaensis NRRL Y-17324]|uniref:Iron-sulfur assembly protein 1 n=1 Tax=Suhomyces tanzawaensis NRRL Y-17324 TaxID=984487 RepID=A0A1E4SF16_9ASCO|nr:uncharacterized protein CANTADRAFT_27045 [Suhomyces tanzawaensis NRRL Y-17324]ODV78114.1 hypothetical protein CANTADRAFT_27045 [Suhomyces tanzawaensis NRRL Y-17324]